MIYLSHRIAHLGDIYLDITRYAPDLVAWVSSPWSPLAPSSTVKLSRWHILRVYTDFERDKMPPVRQERISRRLKAITTVKTDYSGIVVDLDRITLTDIGTRLNPTEDS